MRVMYNSLMLIEIKELPRSKPGARGLPPRICILKCDICGKTYEKKYAKSQVKAKIHRCSLKCAYAARGPGSRGGEVVVRNCAHCGKELPLMTKGSISSEHSFCGKSCYAKWRSEHPEVYAANTAAMHTPEVATKISQRVQERMQQPGYVHPMQGKHHTQETKDAISRHHRDTGCLNGEKNGMFGRRHTKQAREKMSNAVSRRIIEGRMIAYGSKWNVHGHFYAKKCSNYDECFYRSSWELKFMQWLDANDAVESWEYESVRIPYCYNEHKRWYVPDFLVTYIDGTRRMYEIKPAEFVSTERAVLKEAAGRKFCVENNIYEYVVLTGDSLCQMEVT